MNAKDTVIRYEREMLRAFAFIVNAEHPHNFVLNYLNFLGGGKALMQLAWDVLNDRWGEARGGSKALMQLAWDVLNDRWGEGGEEREGKCGKGSPPSESTSRPCLRPSLSSS